MARIEGAELPIRYERASGPAVDAWNARKEENNNDRYASAKLRQSFEENKDAVIDDIGSLLESVDRVK